MDLQGRLWNTQKTKLSPREFLKYFISQCRPVVVAVEIRGELWDILNNMDSVERDDQLQVEDKVERNDP